MTGTLEHRASRSADRLVLKGETREGRYWERSARRRRTSRETRNEHVLRGSRLAVGLLGTQGEDKMNDEDDENEHGAVHHLQRRDG